MEARLARIETHVEHLNVDVGDLRSGVVRLDTKIDDAVRRLDAKIDDAVRRLDAKIDDLGRRLEAKIDRHFLILAGMIVSLGIGMAGLLAKGFHWL